MFEFTKYPSWRVDITPASFWRHQYRQLVVAHQHVVLRRQSDAVISIEADADRLPIWPASCSQTGIGKQAFYLCVPLPAAAAWAGWTRACMLRVRFRPHRAPSVRWRPSFFRVWSSSSAHVFGETWESDRVSNEPSVKCKRPSFFFSHLDNIIDVSCLFYLGCTLVWSWWSWSF